MNSASEIGFKDKFVAFIDILGFTQMVEESDNNSGLSLSQLLELLSKLGSDENREQLIKHGPHICPQSKYIQRDLDFQLTQISDCAIISTEISPAGIIHLVEHCWTAVAELLHEGIMCRGYITRGNIYHQGNQVIGTGYLKAYKSESQVIAFRRKADETGTPFVEIDPGICSYIRDCCDSCVKEMFSRMVKDDGSVTALFPFKRLSHSFIAGGFGYKFDPEKARRSNQNVRGIIERMKERVLLYVDESKPRAMEKAEHYIQALDEQLVVCDKTDAAISFFSGK